MSVDFKTCKYLANSTDHLFKQLLYNFFVNLATSLIQWNDNIQLGSDLFFPHSSLTAGKLLLNCSAKSSFSNAGLRNSFPFFFLSQNNRMLEFGRNLWRSSGPHPLLKQSHLQTVVQDHVQTAFEYL